MQIEKHMTVREIAVGLPPATRLFEKLGIDYCCGGQKALEEACIDAGKSLTEVVAALETLRDFDPGQSDDVDWSHSSLATLTQNIIEQHHQYVQRELPRLNTLIEKIVKSHGEKRPEMLKVRELIRQMTEEFTQHMRKEEAVLFPYINDLEQRALRGAPCARPVFGTVANPIEMMVQDHEATGDLLRQIRDCLSDRSGCLTTQEFFRSIDHFISDLHQHVHKENNILFPRALSLEQATASTV